MGQRTKRGNCSSRRNLSFNWHLVLAPDFVLRCRVAHEVMHLVVPDHSTKFWLTVQGLCHDTDRAKPWLSRHHAEFTVSLESVVHPVCSIEPVVIAHRRSLIGSCGLRSLRRSRRGNGTLDAAHRSDDRHRRVSA
ncbi:MAG: M48 family metallopeptidase [Acidobacteriia bacterium]|nr:M48 family metallopeptidase [Terriglobia bacterium]MYG01815.1 M48 family metallopeptidase [Terriglobia bacterium]MYK08443.1 M48 family metallopeptidase [Terriglobia bacterium]